MILGSSDHPSDASVEWTEIETRVCEILTKITRLESTTKWSIARLCLVMQPYWLLHLPGAMYSVAIGESKGPAADERAEAQLHGKELPSDLSAASSSSTRIQTQKSSKSLVLAGLRKLFTNARGILERGERRRVVQRAKLRAGLRSSLAQEILHLGQDTQIVGLLLSFIGRLLESGGPRKAVLALSSIETYFSSIAQELLEHAWDFDFESAEPEELQTLFEKIADRVTLATPAIWAAAAAAAPALWPATSTCTSPPQAAAAVTVLSVAPLMEALSCSATTRMFASAVMT